MYRIALALVRGPSARRERLGDTRIRLYPIVDAAARRAGLRGESMCNSVVKVGPISPVAVRFCDVPGSGLGRRFCSTIMFGCASSRRVVHRRSVALYTMVLPAPALRRRDFFVDDHVIIRQECSRRELHHLSFWTDTLPLSMVTNGSTDRRRRQELQISPTKIRSRASISSQGSYG